MKKCSRASLLLAAAVVATVASALAQDVKFEMSSVACLLPTGEHGRCLDIRNCPPVLETFRIDPPEPCGFNGTFPRVCCPSPIGAEMVHTTTDRPTTLSISAPVVNFECGVRSPETIIHPPGWEPSITPGSFLRPGHDLPERHEARHQRSSFQPMAIPEGVTVDINAWPWMALIGERKDQDFDWFCGGVLINDEWVLSALHCFLFRNVHVVRLGEHDHSDDHDGANEIDLDVAEIIVYPGYIHPKAYHDLALLRLGTKVTFQKGIRPVCLPWGKESSVDITGKIVTLTGWGDTSHDGFPSNVLQEANVTVFPSSQCDENYSDLIAYPDFWPKGIGNETVCAGDERGGRDACQGDSGGPIVSLNPAGSYTLAGIISKGYGCGLKGYPGLYVNLRHRQYLAWIKKVAF